MLCVSLWIIEISVTCTFTPFKMQHLDAIMIKLYQIFKDICRIFPKL